MRENLLVAISIIFALGAVAQWIAWRFKLPSILILLIFGFLVGPVFGWLNPSALFGHVLFPCIAGAVAIIMFEGGLTLSWRDWRKGTGSIIVRLVSVGVLVSWILTFLAAKYILGFNTEIALLMGAILVITGPTVIGPMLRLLKPKGKARNILKWEGILNDPVGAVLAVLIFEATLLGGVSQAPVVLLEGIIRTLIIGFGIGGAFSAVMILSIKYKLVPQSLHNSIAFAFAIGAYTLSDIIQHESGLLTVTVMGIALANQKDFVVHHIVEFKENLRTLIISTLFIVLAARLDLDILANVDVRVLYFLVALFFVIRPLSVLASTVFTRSSWKERVFLMMVAPRGIVVLAISTIFSLRLLEKGVPQADELLANMVIVVVGTILFYGLMAGPVAQRLGLSNLNPRGLVFIGAHPWATALAVKLEAVGIPIALIDTNKGHVASARDLNLTAYCGNVFSEDFLEEVDFSEMGKVVALTASNEVNAFAHTKMEAYFDHSKIYHLIPDQAVGSIVGEMKTEAIAKMNALFGDGIGYTAIQQAFKEGATFQTIMLKENYDEAAFEEKYGSPFIPLFSFSPGEEVDAFTVKRNPRPRKGDTLVFLA